MTIIEKIIISAYDVEESGHKPFSAEDLIVMAWKNFPDAFGLSGYFDKEGKKIYPDSNRVLVEIMGSKSIRKRGLLIKVGCKMYQLTESGYQYASFIKTRLNQEKSEKTSLSRNIEKEFNRLLNTKAVKKFQNGKVDELTFYDLCGFLGISPRSINIELEGRISNFIQIISNIENIVKDKNFVFKYGGPIYSDNNIKILRNVFNVFLKKFEKELNIIKKRKNENDI